MLKRVERIMDRMDLGWLAEAGQLFQKRDEWIHTLSATDMAAIHLARAFIMNPEVRPPRAARLEGNVSELVWLEVKHSERPTASSTTQQFATLLRHMTSEALGWDPNPILIHFE